MKKLPVQHQAITWTSYDQHQAMTWTNDDTVHLSVHTSPGPNELIRK